MTREQHLQNAADALHPVKTLLQKDRAGMTVTFNPLMIQLAIEFAKAQALLAIAGGTAIAAEVLDAAVGSTSLAVQPQPDPPQNGGRGLVLPS